MSCNNPDCSCNDNTNNYVEYDTNIVAILNNIQQQLQEQIQLQLQMQKQLQEQLQKQMQVQLQMQAQMQAQATSNQDTTTNGNTIHININGAKIHPDSVDIG